MSGLDALLHHPLTHRTAKHTHDYGLYVTLAIFQKEFLILMGSGALVIIAVSYVQWKLRLEEKE